jgi:hypothetical protein
MTTSACTHIPRHFTEGFRAIDWWIFMAQPHSTTHRSFVSKQHAENGAGPDHENQLRLGRFRALLQQRSKFVGTSRQDHFFGFAPTGSFCLT